MIAVCIGLALSSMILCSVALTMACICWAKVVGMEKSTHQIQYVPFDEPTVQEDGTIIPPVTGEALDEQMKKAFGSAQHEKEYI